MDMVQTDNLIFEYEKRDEEGNVTGTYRAIDGEYKRQRRAVYCHFGT